VVERDEAVVLDMEAGVEHLGRGTAGAVDWMLVVSDANQKSLATAATIAGLASEAGISNVAMLGNRVENDAQKGLIGAFSGRHGIPLLGMVPFDMAVVQAGISGDSILKLEGAVALQAIEDMTRKLVQRGKP
jgi:CO dehydrogenase maturation factor